MVNFPKATIFNRRIPKQKFYDKLNISGQLEQQFIKEINTIWWKNKLSPETINVGAGKYVKEIEVIEINLKEQHVSKGIVEAVDKGIPYHIVFIARYKDLGQIWISFKEEIKNREGKFKVDTYYKTGWIKYDALSLEITGLDLDRVYENFLVQVAGGKLQMSLAGKQLTIKEAVQRAKEKERLESLIKTLENKIRNEKQYNIQVKLMGELRKAKEQLSNETEWSEAE